jgi:HEAT repeat protein
MARALAALALHGVDKDLVIEHIGPSRMNMLLRSGSTDQILLWSICNSNTLSESDWDFMEQSKPVFAAMLHICENKEVYAHFQEFASTVLIQCSNAMARCVLNHNQVQGLLKLFSTSPNMQIRVNIIKTLANQPLRECTEEDATFLKCAIHTCVEILSTIHSDNDGRSLCKDALMELMHLSHLLSFSSTLFTDDVEPNMNVFVSFLLSNEDVNILLFALNIIWNMTFRSSAQAKFIETNGMDIIMPLLSREEVQIRRVATAIVCNLSYYNLPHRALLAETPAYLDRLRRSSTDDDMGVQLYAMAALKNIEGDECTVDSFHVFSTMIVNNKPRHANKQPSELIPILSFASDHNEAVRCLAIKELYSFAKSNTYSCCILRELEVIPLLIRLLSDQVSDVKISALKLLHYLASYSCFDEESIKDTGGIPTFIQLLTNDNKDIRSFAANLLLKLSYFRQVQTGEI